MLAHAPDHLFRLVGDVEQYPKFVPWCTGMRTWNHRELSPTMDQLDAEAAVSFSFVREKFATRVRRDAAHRTIDVVLLYGPFRRLSNRWRFEDHAKGCLVHFDIDFEFKVPMLGRLLSANFQPAVDKLIGCFEARAAQTNA